MDISMHNGNVGISMQSMILHSDPLLSPGNCELRESPRNQEEKYPSLCQFSCNSKMS